MAEIYYGKYAAFKGFSIGFLAYYDDHIFIRVENDLNVYLEDRILQSYLCKVNKLYNSNPHQI